MIEAAISLYGRDAATAVAWSVLDARMAGRKSDCHFWFQIFKRLTGSGTAWTARNGIR